MTKWKGAALFLAMVLLFLVANRAAYQGYFQGGDLNGLARIGAAQPADFAANLISPLVSPASPHPAADLYYFALAHINGLDFRRYIAVLHALHFLNLLILWFLLRRLGFAPVAAEAGCLLFAFHIGTFDAYWKPAAASDVLCATFCLLSLFAFVRGRYILSFVAFWLASKSSESAVMLPFAFAAYEHWLGERRWKRLIPFAAVALSFGLQAIWLHSRAGAESPVGFRPPDVWKCIDFYSSELLLIRHAGLIAVYAGMLWGERRLRFGVVLLCLLVLPMLFLPGELSSAHLYAPLIGGAIAAAVIAGRRRTTVVVVFFLLWLPANYLVLRVKRRAALAQAHDYRTYTTQLAEIAREAPAARGFVYDWLPPSLDRQGVEGALHYLYPGQALEIRASNDTDLGPAFRQEDATVLLWDPVHEKLDAVRRDRATPDAAYISMNRRAPVWQLGEGWYPLEADFRWTKPRALARLYRPNGVTQFELRVDAAIEQIPPGGRVAVRVTLNGGPLGRAEITRPGGQTLRWNLPAGTAGPVEIGLEVEPEFRPGGPESRSLGVAVAGLGFVQAPAR